LYSGYPERFNTKIPFEGGTCDAAINGEYMAVYYAREMYSGHQSCSAWIINTTSMETVKLEKENYQSHSFGQRVVSFGDVFVFMSEGDCFDRAFTFYLIDLNKKKYVQAPIFDFYVKQGTYDAYNMLVLNNNFAHLGDICDLHNGTVSFVASSVRSMNENATNEIEQIFIQIFNPQKKLSKKSAYITTGKRSGIAGYNGDQNKTNYGVKWLTNIKSGKIWNPQAVSDESGNTFILFERTDKNGKNLGVYMLSVDSNGNIIKKASRISKTAQLNNCETPILINNVIYWCGNKVGDTSNELYVFKIETDEFTKTLEKTDAEIFSKRQTKYLKKLEEVFSYYSENCYSENEYTELLGIYNNGILAINKCWSTDELSKEYDLYSKKLRDKKPSILIDCQEKSIKKINKAYKSLVTKNKYSEDGLKKLNGIKDDSFDEIYSQRTTEEVVEIEKKTIISMQKVLYGEDEALVKKLQEEYSTYSIEEIETLVANGFKNSIKHLCCFVGSNYLEFITEAKVKMLEGEDLYSVYEGVWYYIGPDPNLATDEKGMICFDSNGYGKLGFNITLPGRWELKDNKIITYDTKSGNKVWEIDIETGKHKYFGRY
ncbi:MAG: hypothetical protein IK007_11375, partial [Lachnospiraceae bacterium]|nr:hypothetical protein [Lachnospiraceae bacterium]